MEKYNILKIMDIIYNDTNDKEVQSKLRTYISTITHMTEKDYKEIQDFYLKFVIKYFLHQLNKTK